MLWSDLYTNQNQPSNEQIDTYVNTPLWDELAAHLQDTYRVQPSVIYSGSAMDGGAWKGWNVKYKKGGRALCSLYPQQGHFLALVNIGAREAAEADLLMPLCDTYTQDVYRQTELWSGGKMLALKVDNAAVLQDLEHLVALRAASRKKASA